ncbi:hypothetical protein LZ32DRAFT_645409 [Colletotrichum eremochloae]|nr:hypothetical protein LZ32DRAFT_645409 [Colletotrichum eremochloae]
MATKEFHLFSLLPGEVRNQIWDYSVRPHSIGGVQYFSVFPDDQIPDKFSRHLIPKIHKFQFDVIGPPISEDAESTPSWNLNRSTYSIDGGLWTACKDSRAAMHRRYEPERWSELYDNQRNGVGRDYWEDYITRVQNYYNVPATFLVNSDSGHQYFTLLPAQDLIIIRGYPSVPDMNHILNYIPFTSPLYGFGDPRLQRGNTKTLAAIQNLAREALEEVLFEGNGYKYYQIADQPGFLSVWDFAHELEYVATRIEAFKEREDEYDARIRERSGSCDTNNSLWHPNFLPSKRGNRTAETNVLVTKVRSRDGSAAKLYVQRKVDEIAKLVEEQERKKEEGLALQEKREEIDRAIEKKVDEISELIEEQERSFQKAGGLTFEDRLNQALLKRRILDDDDDDNADAANTDADDGDDANDDDDNADDDDDDDDDDDTNADAEKVDRKALSYEELFRQQLAAEGISFDDDDDDANDAIANAATAAMSEEGEE